MKRITLAILLLTMHCSEQARERLARNSLGNWRCNNAQFIGVERDNRLCEERVEGIVVDCFLYAKQANCTYIGYVAPKDNQDKD